jgi:hypothetical protein
VDDERGDLDLGQALAPAGFAVEPGKHQAYLVGQLDRGCGAGRAVPDARGDYARGDGVVAEDLRAGGGEFRNRLAVGPIGHRTREQPAHRRLVMVGEVSVGRARSNRAGADQGEGRERARMIEHGHLGDHPADADPREVRRPPAERVSKGRRVGGEAAEGVGGRLRIRRRRLPAIAQVVAHHPAPAGGEALAQRVGPGEHRRPAREQDEWRVVVTERLDAQGDPIGVDSGHQITGSRRRSVMAGQTRSAARTHRSRVKRVAHANSIARRANRAGCPLRRCLVSRP